MPSTQRLSPTSITPPIKRDWKMWEADILVACGLKHQFVTVFEPESGQLLQSFIHGFDLEQSLLLLDGLYPWPESNLSTHDIFWLQVRCDHGFFNLKVALVEIEKHTGGEWLTVKVLETEISHNRRWHTRVFFETREGPRVDLQIDHHPLQRAYVSNLSRQGALIELYGTNLSLALVRSRRLRGKFNFNQHFQLELEGTLKQSQFLRVPCSHTQLRVQFNHLTAEQQLLLDSFVATVATPPDMGMAALGTHTPHLRTV